MVAGSPDAALGAADGGAAGGAAVGADLGAEGAGDAAPVVLVEAEARVVLVHGEARAGDGWGALLVERAVALGDRQRLPERVERDHEQQDRLDDVQDVDGHEGLGGLSQNFRAWAANTTRYWVSPFSPGQLVALTFLCVVERCWASGG